MKLNIDCLKISKRSKSQTTYHRYRSMGVPNFPFDPTNVWYFQPIVLMEDRSFHHREARRSPPIMCWLDHNHNWVWHRYLRTRRMNWANEYGNYSVILVRHMMMRKIWHLTTRIVYSNLMNLTTVHWVGTTFPQL